MTEKLLGGLGSRIKEIDRTIGGYDFTPVARPSLMSARSLLLLELENHIQVMLRGFVTFACTPKAKVYGTTLEKLCRIKFAFVKQDATKSVDGALVVGIDA